ncbi:hypothetical protein OS493_015727 [Desmophyllum pertusum]|uniref:Uncharacterized protein n=1 Tax=Desmophyllum pertusum TaxID=174260 RepID=A0A9W9YS98_9CNID|nr:hypothetical protein OS493_015727 [Desmophyllum pertusum]
MRASKAVLEALGFKATTYASTGGADLQERRNSTPLTIGYLEKRWHQSASQGNLPGIVALLEQDPNLVTTQGYTALHLAVIQGHENVITSLFDCGADIDARDYSGRKPKHYIKNSTSPWIQKKLGRKLAPSVLVSSGDTLNKGLPNIGSIFLQMKALSNSLGTGLDKLDSDPGVFSSTKTESSTIGIVCEDLQKRYW